MAAAGLPSRISPRVAIGLPVFNGEDYLEAAIDSILSQTYEDFELILCDNASTDRTPDICKSYVAGDSRVRYYRHAENIGASENYNTTFRMSSSQYFKWAAHDDVLAPDYLARCVETLDKDPSLVLCHTRTYKINAAGDVAGVYRPDPFLRSGKPHVRYRDLIRGDHLAVAIFGLIRSDALKRTPLMGCYPGSDWNLQAELALFGQFHEVPEHLFLRRSHPKRSTRTPLHDRMGWYDPKKSGQIILPAWRQFWGYFQSPGRADLSLVERLRCYLSAAEFAWFRHYQLLVDVKACAQRLLGRGRYARVPRAV